MTSKRVFVFKAQDGSMWAFPGEIVAHNRAEYYAKEDPDTTYREEFEFTMSDRYALSDWLHNNMNFEDFSAYVVKYRDAPAIDLAAAWLSDDRQFTEMISPTAERLQFPELPEVPE